MIVRPDLSDEEVDQICAGYTQHLAKVRFLQRLGLRVYRRPNGRPLVARAEWERVFGRVAGAAPAPVDTGIRWKKPPLHGG